MGLGAVLSQVHDWEEHPIMYICQKLIPKEKKYSIVEKECLVETRHSNITCWVPTSPWSQTMLP